MKFGTAFAGLLAVLLLAGCKKSGSADSASAGALGTSSTTSYTTGTSASGSTGGGTEVKPKADLADSAKPIANPQLVGTYRQDLAASMTASQKADPNAAAFIKNNEGNATVIQLNADGTAKFTGSATVKDAKGVAKASRLTLDAFLTKDGDDQVLVVKIPKPKPGGPKSIVMQVRTDDNGATIRVSPRGSNGQWDYFKKS